MQAWLCLRAKTTGLIMQFLTLNIWTDNLDWILLNMGVNRVRASTLSCQDMLELKSPSCQPAIMTTYGKRGRLAVALWGP